MFTAFANVYQAARLNTMLNQLGMRLEPIDTRARKPPKAKKNKKKW